MRFCDIPSFVTTPPFAGLPRVRFLCGAVEVIKRERWMFKASGGLYLSRQQLPLKLAWAISIHKSQVSSALMSHHESFCICSKLRSQPYLNWLHRMEFFYDYFYKIVPLISYCFEPQKKLCDFIENVIKLKSLGSGRECFYVSVNRCSGLWFVFWLIN